MILNNLYHKCAKIWYEMEIHISFLHGIQHMMF